MHGKRALVTGGAGFVGSHLCERLVAEGAEVVAVDDFSTGRRANLRALSGDARFTLIAADVVQPLPITGAIDVIFHLACPASPVAYARRPIETLRTCSEGTLRLLELAASSSASFVLASTSEVYGDPTVHPQDERYFGNVNPIGPRSPYDEGKRYAEALTMAYRRARGVDARIVRIFNTYGPRMDPDDGRVVTSFVSSALRGEPLRIHGDGTQTRSFQYVDDLIEALVRVMRVPSFEGPINVGNPTEHTILELADEVRRLTTPTLPLERLPKVEDDPTRRRPDIARAKRLLEWEPRVTLREGLARTIDHLRRELLTERSAR